MFNNVLQHLLSHFLSLFLFCGFPTLINWKVKLKIWNEVRMLLLVSEIQVKNDIQNALTQHQEQLNWLKDIQN